jgi:hypothetical protein
MTFLGVLKLKDVFRFVPTNEALMVSDLHAFKLQGLDSNYHQPFNKAFKTFHPI